jgi:hypothetical protein
VSDATLRRKVEETATKLDEARARYNANLDDKSGRALLKAREAARDALRDLWAACPEDKPPTQHVI